MLFSCNEDGEDIFVWCQGTVIDCIRREYSCGWEEIESYYSMGELLKMSDWNPQQQKEGVWREDLHHHHKVLNIE